MLILYGVKSKMEREMWAGADECSVCGATRDRFIARKRTAPTLFYIPVVWFNAGRYLITCENCQTGTKLKKKEYNEIRDKMTDAFEKVQFPAYVANNYFTTKALGKTGKIVKVVFAWIWALLAGFVAVTNGANAILSALNGRTESESAAIAVIALILGVIPVILAHKGLSKVNKLLKTAKLYEGKVDAPAAEVLPVAEAVTAAETAPVNEENVSAPAAEETATVAE